MRDPIRHLPFGLVLFLIAFIGATDLAIGAELRVLITLLAPVFWLGIYLLGSSHAAPARAAPTSPAVAAAPSQALPPGNGKGG